MANRNDTSAWLKRLEEGTSEIYSRYQKLVAASREGYEEKRKSLDREYNDAANMISATSKIDLKNSLEKMADAGYVRSGETVHATLSANTAKLGALSELEREKAQQRGALDQQELEQEAEWSAQADREAAEFRRELEEAERDQANRDREFQAAEEQRAIENALAREKWEVQKKSASQSVSTSTQAKSEDDGIRPSIGVQEYLQSIVEQNTKVYRNKGYKVENRTEIAKAIQAVVNDGNLSVRYRYEFYLYAKSMGYIKD